MILHRPTHLNQREVMIFTWTILGALILVEAGVAFHLYTERDIATVLLVVTGWAKEAIRSFVEHVLEAL